MLVGYARTSTADQIAGYEDQIAHLTKLGAEKVFAEQASAVASRPQLETCLDFLRENDILIVTRLDRLCRSSARCSTCTVPTCGRMRSPPGWRSAGRACSGRCEKRERQRDPPRLPLSPLIITQPSSLGLGTPRPPATAASHGTARAAVPRIRRRPPQT
jgi:hypothetical protein